MKKLATLLATLALAVLFCVPTNAESVLLNGQKHYYTVQLRSDKRAIVYARIIFENPSADKDLSTYEFSLPKNMSAENSSAQQILAKATDSRTCKTYETLDQWRVRMNGNKSTSYIYPDTSYSDTKQCAEWQAAAQYDENYDYDQSLSSSTNYYYYSYYQNRDTKFDYIDLTQKNEGSNYTISLSEPIKPKKQGSILISFTTNNFVTGGVFGRYDYNVRTLLAKQMIDKATVSVNFDDDMFTREATQKRTYETNNSSSKNITQGATADSAYQSESIDSLVNSVGKGGIYVKSQSSLLPGDTLSVTGVFGTNSLVLYGSELIIALLALGLIAVIAWLYINWRKVHPRKKMLGNDSSDTSRSLHHTTVRYYGDTVWGKIFLTSTASVVGTIVTSLALSGVINGTAYGLGTASMLADIGMIIVILFGSAFLPALYMLRYGIKNVFKWGLVQFILIVVLLLILAAIATSGSTPYYD